MRFQVDRWTDPAGELVAGGFGAAGDVNDFSAEGRFDYAQLTAKGSLGQQAYGDGSALYSAAQASDACSKLTGQAQEDCEVSAGRKAIAALTSYTALLATALGGPLAGTVVGAAVGAILNAVGPAHGSGGMCGYNNENAPDPSGDWATWPNQWEYGHGSYPAPAPGSFEAFADHLLRANMALNDNCWPDKAVAPPIVLAGAIEAWNRLHSSSSQHTVTRSGLNAATPGGFQSGTVYPGPWDPIADALNDVAGMAGQRNATLSFVVNDGGELGAVGSVVGVHMKAGKQYVQPKLAFGPNLGAVITQAAPRKPATSATTKAVVAAAGALLLVALVKPSLLRGLPLLGKMVRR
jgi:hypothetical protein